jgi:hypothetical protein
MWYSNTASALCQQYERNQIPALTRDTHAWQMNATRSQTSCVTNILNQCHGDTATWYTPICVWPVGKRKRPFQLLSFNASVSKAIRPYRVSMNNELAVLGQLQDNPSGRAVAGVAGSNPARGMDICLLYLCVDWIRLAQDKDRWRAVVSAVMNLRVLAPRSVCVVLSSVGRGFCDGLITRPEESYRVCVCEIAETLKGAKCFSWEPTGKWMRSVTKTFLPWPLGQQFRRRNINRGAGNTSPRWDAALYRNAAWYKNTDRFVNNAHATLVARERLHQKRHQICICSDILKL